MGEITESIALEIDERATRVAGIDRRVGLDEEAVVGHPDLGAGEREEVALVEVAGRMLRQLPLSQQRHIR